MQKKNTDYESLAADRETHRSHRAPWLRALVLGVIDGIVSTSSVLLGVAAASSSRSALLVAGFASLFAGAMSMAAGEYVSVSSQKDAEKADLAIEAKELEMYGDEELNELSRIYVDRGLEPKLAKEVARQLHEHDALAAHARDELGIDTEDLANPMQASLASALAFTSGGSLPILAAVLVPGNNGIFAIVITALVALTGSGAVGARIGGGNKKIAAARVLVGGSIAMAVTAAIGKLVGIAV